MRIYTRNEASLDVFKKNITKYKMLYSLYLYKLYRTHKKITFSDNRDTIGADCQSPGFPINTSIAFSNKYASSDNTPLYFKIETTYGYFDSGDDLYGEDVSRFEKNYIYSYHIQRYDSLLNIYRGLKNDSCRFVMRYSYRHIPLHWAVYNRVKLYKMTAIRFY